MRERLREVPYLAADARVVLLGQQTDVVGEAGEPVGTAPAPRRAADQRQAVGEPERARQERALTGRQAVVGVARVVAEQEPVDAELALHRLHGPDHARVVRRRKPTIGIISVAASSVGEP